MSSRKNAGRRDMRKNAPVTSDVIAMFDQLQIEEFKKAFSMIDRDQDGFIEKADLRDLLTSLGKNPTEECLEGMMNEAPGSINFTMFVTMFAERMKVPKEVIKNAFGCFDDQNAGVINEDRLRELLTTKGDRLTDEEVDELFRVAPIKNGLLDYNKFTRILKNSAADKDEATSSKANAEKDKDEATSSKANAEKEQ
uniref:EF-hand domain-containing protein n=1 Tax=Anopheles dirus TaxID=7168 RepID=A0A182NQ47_9DIPT